jgi:hypothetical protein
MAEDLDVCSHTSFNTQVVTIGEEQADTDGAK